jgi:hypothetical protein
MRKAGVRQDRFVPSDRNTALFLEIGDLSQRCKSLARTIKLGRPVRCLSSLVELSPPSRKVADLMVNEYFKSFESTHRILHEPTFWVDYRRYWERSETVSNALQLKVLLVVGIGSSLHEHTNTELRGMVHQWVYAAQNWLSGPLEKDCLDVTGVQIYCLTIMAREIFSIGGDLLWVSLGSLIHRAIQIGLHRDPKYLPPMSLLRAEIRRRLWATILEMVVQSSLDSGLPPRISFDEFDTDAASNINDDEIDDSTIVLQVHPNDIFTTTSMQLLLLRSIPLRLRILQLLNGLRSKIFYPDVLALGSELTETYRTCKNFLSGHEKDGVAVFHRNMLDYMLRRFLLPLHCPFARKASTNPLFHYSRKASLDVAMAIVAYERDEKFSRLLAIGGGMLREGVLSAATAISVELITQAESQRLDGTLLCNLQAREPLKQALRNMISLATERIKQGETNIKTHLFLSMALAQAEAIEAGTCSEIRVAQSAKESLEFCHGMLLTGIVSPNDDDTALNFNGEEDWGTDFDLDFFFPDASSFDS